METKTKMQFVFIVMTYILYYIKVKWFTGNAKNERTSTIELKMITMNVYKLYHR